MNKLTVILIASTLFAMTGTSALAADVEDIIKARQSFMQVYKFNLGLVGNMAKGKTEYNAETAQNAADNLLALSKMKNSSAIFGRVIRIALVLCACVLSFQGCVYIGNCGQSPCL